jgi:gamma-glutamylputrescine oxidase
VRPLLPPSQLRTAQPELPLLTHDQLDLLGHLSGRPRHVVELRAWQDDLATNYGYRPQWWDRERLREELATDRYLGALFDPDSGHLHPLNYTLGLARAALSLGVRIYERSKVTRVVRGNPAVFQTDAGEVICDFGVLAGNAYIRGIAPELDSRIMPVGTYMARPDRWAPSVRRH